MMLYLRWPVTRALLLLPVFMLAAVLAAAGSGLTLSALNVSFRDVKYVVPFMVQMGLFVTPVIYPARYIPHRWQILMGLNPMAGGGIGFPYSPLCAPASWGGPGLSLSWSLFFSSSAVCVFARTV